jgi:apolipoprotein N-acyltransferase
MVLQQSGSSPRPLLAVAALAVSGGALYAAALPPAGLWALGWVALAPLCVACAGASVRRGAVAGLAFGLTAAALTSPWLPAMIGDYFNAPGWSVVPLALAAWVVGGAAYHAIFGAWVAWATSRGTLSPFVVAAVWCVLEWLRANALVPNPWALLGYSQLGWLPAAQIADVVGVYGVGVWLAAMAAGVAALFSPELRGRAVWCGGMLLVVVSIGVVGYGLLQIRTQPAERESIQVGLVQGAIPRAHRYQASFVAENLAAHLELTARAKEAGAQLVVWPELAIDFYLEREPLLRARLLDGLTAQGVDLLAGGLGVGKASSGNLPTNSVFLISEGAVMDRYDKVRLMAFSEALPTLLAWLGPNPVVAGEEPKILQADGVPFGLAVCSEAMHPDFVRETVLAGAQILLVPSVDSWFGSGGGSRQQLGAAAMRAIETRRFVVRPTATGVTAVIDPIGRVVAEAPIDEPAVLVVDVEPRTGTTRPDVRRQHRPGRVGACGVRRRSAHPPSGRQGVELLGVPPTSNLDGPERVEVFGGFAGLLPGALLDDHRCRVILGERFEASGQVRGVAEGCPEHAAADGDIAHVDRPRRDPDTDGTFGQLFGGQ